MMNLSEIKRRIYKWWMCDFCGGMADPINEGFFWAIVIGTGLAFLIAYLINGYLCCRGVL